MTAAANSRLQSAITTQVTPLIDTIRENIGSVIQGQDQAVDQLVTGLLARGHVLLEGVPGVAKTLLAVCLSKSFSMSFNRIQFTPDLMPADITGVGVFSPKSGDFKFHPGPIFADLVLADEINRASAKTQSALLEAMQERQITVEGKTRPLSKTFMVIATQNPVDMDGTYPLPEAQLDRFLLRIPMEYPSQTDELAMLTSAYERGEEQMDPAAGLKKVCTIKQLEKIQQLVFKVIADDSVLKYINELVFASRKLPAVILGVSPRGGVMLMQAARAYALSKGRGHVLPEDVQAMAPATLMHRLILRPEAEIENITPGDCVETLIKEVPIPR